MVFSFLAFYGEFLRKEDLFVLLSGVLKGMQMGEGREEAHSLQRKRAGGVTGWREERKEGRESLLVWGREAVCAEPPHQDFYLKVE